MSERTMTGQVVSDKMHKTIIVEIIRTVRHKLYGKYLRKKTRIFAHDESNQCQLGDMVVIKETRPISKNKSWALVKILDKATILEMNNVDDEVIN